LIKILADQNLYKLSDLIPKQVECDLFDPNIGLPDLNGFDALLIRSVTKIKKNRFSSLPPTLKFIGTGSSGRDHVDEELLKEHGIHFVDAKGSNANVVAEYVATALFILNEHDDKIAKSKIGIVGVGAVGEKVSELLNKLGFRTILYDPPREKWDHQFRSASLEDVLRCDILTFHVPLERDGQYATYHWLNDANLANRNFLAIINAARGGIVDEKAVMASRLKGCVQYLIFDVWENEPHFNPEFVNHCHIATPHIAGSSVQSKMNASKMLVEKLCTYFDIENRILCSTDRKLIQLENQSSSLEHILSECHPMLKYDELLKKISTSNQRHNKFAKLRTDYPFRYEYPAISIPNFYLEKFPILKKLGIKD